MDHIVATRVGRFRPGSRGGLGCTIVAGVADPPPTQPQSPSHLRGRFVGRLVVVEPLDRRARAGTDPGRRRARAVRLDAGRHGLLARCAAALAGGLARTPAQPVARCPSRSSTRRTGAVLGSTRFLELRFEHLRAEIGWTWLTRSAWSTGANVETKLLLLEHAFEHAGLRRVEFKTDARNERSRGALLALGATL